MQIFTLIHKWEHIIQKNKQKNVEKKIDNQDWDKGTLWPTQGDVKPQQRYNVTVLQLFFAYMFRPKELLLYIYNNNSLKGKQPLIFNCNTVTCNAFIAFKRYTLQRYSSKCDHDTIT